MPRKDSPIRGALFYLVVMFTLILVGAPLQRGLGPLGTMLSPLLIFLGLAVLFAVYGEGRPAGEVLRWRPVPVGVMAKSAVLGLVAALLVQVLGMLMVEFVQRAGGTLPTYYADLTQTSFLMAFLVRGVVYPISEECAFRGYLQEALSPLGARWAVLLAGLLFGAMHMSLIRLLPLALLGVIFGAAVQRSGSILPGVMMHMLNNLLALALTFFAEAPAHVPIWALLAGALALGLATWALLRSFGTSPEPGERQPVREVLLALLPALALFAWSAYKEITLVFFSSPGP